MLLLTINVVALGRSTYLCALVCALLVLVLLILVRRTRAATTVALAVTIGSTAYFALPILWDSPWAAIVGGLGFWATRFGIAAGTGFWLLATTTVGELAAALERLRVPRAIVIPLTVMLRFLPLVVEELRAIIDAMRLRGVIPGVGTLITRPIRAVEYVMMPLLAAMIRMTDDLSASAMLRGLGSKTRRTSIIRLGFGPIDAVYLIVMIGLVALRMSGWDVPW